ncbi:MAG TPA: hypothetical protein VK796_11610 [Cytophaga sp.]|nr:hypothetical protein [Cytophaga sp.]
MKKTPSIFASVILFSVIFNASAQDDPKPAPADAAELAKKLSNPVASLISLPFQNNTDIGIGTYNGSRNTLNVQPVIPVKLTSGVNMIARFVCPIVSQYNISGEGKQESGLGSTTASAFFAPSSSKNGLIWGVGPAFLIPTTTNRFLGTKKFGVGPTALILKQTHGFTIGALANQLWSIGGDAGSPGVNQLFLQPFLTYNWKSGAGLGVNGEITQNWKASTTTAFINPTLSGITKLGTQVVSLAVGPRIQVAAPEGAKSAFGVRAVLIFVFPK